MKILIAGVGGVGGLLAGQLIKKYADEVTLLARGAKREHYLNYGLTIESDLYGDYNVMPAGVVEDAEGLGVQDLIIVSVKNGSLEGMLDKIQAAVDGHTIIMPVMNGVSAPDVIHRRFPDAHTMMSVIYTVSMVNEHLAIRQLGQFTRIFAGPVVENEQERVLCRRVVETFTAAGIEIKESADVRADCWSKYVLNSAFNGVTARWGITIGDIKHSEELKKDYRAVMDEAWQVGRALGVNLPDDLVERHMSSLERSTDDSTSSLSRDFDAHIFGEAELFSKDIADMGKSVGIKTPYLDSYYQGMVERSQSWK